MQDNSSQTLAWFSYERNLNQESKDWKENTIYIDTGIQTPNQKIANAAL